MKRGEKMKYKIMRMHQNRNQLLIDLYNEYFGVNIELKFCCNGLSYEYNPLIFWLGYCERVRQDVTPEDIIKLYEDISIKNKIDKNNKK